MNSIIETYWLARITYKRKNWWLSVFTNLANFGRFNFARCRFTALWNFLILVEFRFCKFLHQYTFLIYSNKFNQLAPVRFWMEQGWEISISCRMKERKYFVWKKICADLETICLGKCQARWRKTDKWHIWLPQHQHSQ